MWGEEDLEWEKNCRDRYAGYEDTILHKQNTDVYLETEAIANFNIKASFTLTERNRIRSRHTHATLTHL